MAAGRFRGGQLNPLNQFNAYNITSSRPLRVLNPFFILRRNSLYRGMSGNKVWLIVGAVVWAPVVLRKIFGPRYEDYSARVPRFMPRLGRPHEGSGAFSWAQVAENKEYVNVIWVVILSSLFVLKLMWGGRP